MREIEAARQASEYLICIPENFETIVKTCVQKMEKDNYKALRIYQKIDLRKIHDDFTYKLRQEIISWYKLNISVNLGSRHIILGIERSFMNKELNILGKLISIWTMYVIMAITVPSENILQYTYCKKYTYLDLKGLPALIKPMKPTFTYRMLNGSSKYIHHPMKLNLSSIYGEMRR